MNLLTWLDALGGAAESSALASRRAALTRLGRTAALVVPGAALATQAVAGPPTRITSVVTDSLNLVLQVAYAQRALLDQALAAPSSPVPAANRAQFEAFAAEAADRVTRLVDSVGNSGDVVEQPLPYDFARGGLSPLTSSADFLGLLQELTDLLSRTLLSTLGPLTGNQVFTELVAQLLGTTSRTAARVRQLRNASPWITGADAAGAPALLAAAYEAEDALVVFNLNLVGTPAVLPDPPRTMDVLTQAFDRPLPLAMGTPAETLPRQHVEALISLIS